MARTDDDFEDDDRPRRPRRRDEEDDRPRRPRRQDNFDDRPLPTAKRSKLPLILGIVTGVLLLVCGGGGYGLYYTIYGVRDMENRKKEFHPVAQISIGAMNYSDSNGTLPANSYAPDGTPLLSWRVHILPYMGEERLYLQFHLDEPWDSPHNRSLLNRMPRIFAGPTQPAARLPTGNRTPYRGFSMPGALMEPPTARKGGGPNGLSQADVTDGPANTLLFVKAATAVEWTKPDDLSWTYGQPAPAFGTDPTDKVFFACFANGEIKPLRKTITPEQLKAAVTYAGGESETLD